MGQNFALTEIAYVTTWIRQVFERLEERCGEERGMVGFRTNIILTPVKRVQIGLIYTEKTG